MCRSNRGGWQFLQAYLAPTNKNDWDRYSTDRIQNFFRHVFANLRHRSRLLADRGGGEHIPVAVSRLFNQTGYRDLDRGVAMSDASGAIPVCRSARKPERSKRDAS